MAISGPPTLREAVECLRRDVTLRELRRLAPERDEAQREAFDGFLALLSADAPTEQLCARLSEAAYRMLPYADYVRAHRMCQQAERSDKEIDALYDLVFGEHWRRFKRDAEHAPTPAAATLHGCNSDP